MKAFAVKLKNGKHLLGIAVSTTEGLEVLNGESATIDLESVGVGLWFKEADGSRTFIQPRDSQIVLIQGSTKEEIGKFLGVNIP